MEEEEDTVADKGYNWFEACDYNWHAFWC
jgi:hypothetical protein